MHRLADANWQHGVATCIVPEEAVWHVACMM